VVQIFGRSDTSTRIILWCYKIEALFNVSVEEKEKKKKKEIWETGWVISS